MPQVTQQGIGGARGIRGQSRVISGFLTAALLLSAATVGGTDQPAPARAAVTVAGGIHEQRQAVAEQLDALSGAGSTSKPGSPVSSDGAEAKGEALTLLRSLDALLAQHEALLEERRQLEMQLKQTDEARKTLEEFGPDEPKPYSFLLLDNLQDDVAVEKDREAAIKADVKSAERLLRAAHEELNTVANERRKPAEQPAAKAGDKGHPAQPATQLDVAELAVSVPREKVRLKQLAVEVQKLKLDLCQATQKQLTKRIDLIQKDIAFSVQDRERQSERLAAKETELRHRRRQAQNMLQEVEANQAAELKELAAKGSPQRVLDAANAAWRAVMDAYQSEVLLLDQQIEGLGEIRKFWKRRYELATKTVESDKLSHWLSDVDELREQLDESARSLEHRRDAASTDLAAAGGHSEGDRDPALERWADFREGRLKELRDLVEGRLADIKATQRALGRFRAELKTKLQTVPAAWPGSLADAARRMLGYKVAGSDEEAVTLGRILLLLAWIVVGMLTANFLSRVLGRRLLLWLGMHRGAADAVHTVVFYALCIVFGVAAFQVLQIPLAAFAFLGGAAAIAVGFGGQDIMNNFMSGIILLTEQPIRVGDVVELSAVQGVVQHIGLRSTRIQTQFNHELIVPNKNLLDEQVTNLTLSDNFVQTSVTVTLDRAVPVPPAMLKMHEAVFLHPMVIKSPRPVVLLKEFDPYWSTFEVCFWLEYASYMKCAMVQSQVLEAISELFPNPESSSGSTEPQRGEASSDSEPQPVAGENGHAAAAVENPSAPGLTLTDVSRKSAAAAVRQVKRTSNTTIRRA